MVLKLEISIPKALIPNSLACTRVVPLPQKGSNIISSFLKYTSFLNSSILLSIK